MIGLTEMLDPSFLLFPALVGSIILGLVCPLVGAYLILRRTVFLGLTLPQVAAAGVACAFWLQQLGVLPHLEGGERSFGMIGSLIFTFLGMAILGYLEQEGKSFAEGRLAATYALAGSLTILFIVFNPAGEVEILSLLKGEVITLSKSEIEVLAGVFGLVFSGMIYFRREFLLSSFDRDLAFLLKGGNILWDLILYLLAGLSIAVGVIMAGPLLIFGFMVLPPLAARAIARRMSTFLITASLAGGLMAFCGFYLSVRLDLPLGPTDVALGCGLVFLGYGMRRILTRIGLMAALLVSAVSLASSGCTATTAVPVPDSQALKVSTVWLFKARNSSGLPLRLPDPNPLRSLAEMAGKLAPESRPAVMDLLRESLRRELEQRGFKVALPEERDVRFASLASGFENAPRAAREGGLSGLLWMTEIRRWDADSRQLVRVLVDFRLVRIDDGALLWERRIRRAVSTASAANPGQAHTDAVKALVAEIFQ